MLERKILYIVRYEGAKIGEIKNNIYYDLNGHPWYELRDNFLFNENEKYGVITNNGNNLVMTRLSDNTVFTIHPTE